MMKARLFPLATGFACLILGCNPKDEPKEPVVLNPAGATIEAESAFHQAGYITDALALTPREPDGMLMFSFGTDPSYVSYKYPSKGFDNPTPHLSATTETVPAGTTRTAFHLEFPMTVEQALPEGILDVQSFRMSGNVTFSFTLSPSFPYTEAYVQQATITLPAWVRDVAYPMYMDGRQMEWPFPKTIHPGEVNMYSVYCSDAYDLEEGDGLCEPGHRLVLDATISIDGILCVDENNRKDPQEASSPWSATLLSYLSAEFCRIWSITGHLDLSTEMEGHTLVFSEIPAFLHDNGTNLDLDDVYGELTIRNESSVPVSISGVILGDDREYRFSCPPIQTTDYGEAFHGLLSEKGGRVKDGMEAGYYDIPVQGLSGLIDQDPASFAVKDIRIANDPDTAYEFFFDENNQISFQAQVYSPLLVGKDFQARHLMELFLLNTWDPIERISGTFSVENTLPFDYEIRPACFQGKDELPISFTPVRIPAGNRESPHVETVSFDWPVGTQITKLFFELKGRTANGRQGEALYMDQRISVKDITLEVQYGTKQ